MGQNPTPEPRPGSPRYPNAEVRLSGRDGNAFWIIGWTLKVLGEAGASAEERAFFLDEATSGTYDELLRTVMRWVEVR